MEEKDIVEKFLEFFREYYNNDVILASTEKRKSIIIDFSKLEEFDYQLADEVLKKPEEMLELMSVSIQQMEMGTKLRVRLSNLPKSVEIRIRNLRSEHISKLIVIDGIVKRASEVRPEVAETVFLCPECGNKISILQTELSVRPPVECDCGNKRGFKLVNQTFFDARWIVVEEPYEIVATEKPSEVMIYLKEDLTTPKMQSRTDPGNRIKIVGILKHLPRRIKGTRSRQMEIYVDANYVEPVETEWEELEISAEDEKRIRELASDTEIYQKLVASLAPTIYGHEDVKEALILQMFGGEERILKDKTRIRGDIHVLLIGDPATSKSQLMKLISTLVPRGRYVSGKSATAAGLVASVTKDEEFLGGWVLEAGAVVLANRSICCIDEFEKIDKPDQVALHEALEQGSVSVSKANIQATLPAKTAILAGGNPKLGRFDPYMPIREQIDIPEALLSRFDVRFALRDIPNVEEDKKMADHIITSRFSDEEIVKPMIEPEFLRKYIAYARKNCHPKMGTEAIKMIEDFYLELRKKSEGGSVAISPRQLEALVRLAEASAKIQLRDTVTAKDAERAINLMKASLRQFGFVQETLTFDIDMAEGQKLTALQRSKIRVVLNIIEDLEKAIGKNIPEKDVKNKAEEMGVKNIEEILKKMKEEGVVFSPKPGFIQRVSAT